MKIDVQQGSIEWHALRLNKIGASDAPVIMGVSPWKTPYELWEEKLGLSTTKEINSYQQRGLDLEEQVRNDLYLHLGLEFEPAVFQSNEHECLIASIDAWNEVNRIAVEIKCPGKTDHEIAKEGKVPEKYYPQLQHQMYVLGVKSMIYCSYDGKDEVCIDVPFDPEYAKNMIEKELDFYQKIQTMTPPELTEQDYVDKEDDESWKILAARYVEINAEIADLECEKEQLRKQLVDKSENRNSKGGGVLVSKILRKGNVNYSKIEQLKHINLDDYRSEPVSYWKISCM